MLAIERAIDGIFPLRAAAYRADVAANTGTIAPRAFLLANLTNDVHRG
jgi:hypothetical protein